MSDEIKNIDKYYTIAGPVFAEIKIKGSTFIGGAYPADNSETAIEILKSVRSKYFDASHNCFAYRFGFDGSEFRSSDDGEPSGTAGKPILFMISKYELSDILVIVTRYFGGTKLGVGGLVRAYSDSAEAVLQVVNRKTVNRTRKFSVRCSYHDVSYVKKLIEKEAVDYTEQYTDMIDFVVNVHLSNAENFKENLFNHTNGRVTAIEI
ncbi:MAG: YigZ family protein [Candidatus Kapabacteria bacterium]|jgi:uncharacterized YigZ family protein|nr:YigZ family protein [Candidatus Kapabacteria bacterium]